MSNSGQHEELPNSQNYLNNPSENSNMPFRLQLTPQQAAYLANHLPTHYSFQLETKPIKRATSTTKNIKEPLKASTEVRKKTPKVTLSLFRRKLKTQVGKAIQLEAKRATVNILRKSKMLSMKNTATKKTTEELPSNTSAKPSSLASEYSICWKIVELHGLLESQ